MTINAAEREGIVPVPANRCTRCAGRLRPPEEGEQGERTGWFRPSPIDGTTWLFTSRPEPEGDGAPLYCPACDRAYRLF